MRSIIAIASAALLAATASAGLVKRQNAVDIERPADFFGGSFEKILKEDFPKDGSNNPNHLCRVAKTGERIVCCEPPASSVTEEIGLLFDFADDFNKCTEHPPPAGPKPPLQAGESRDILMPSKFIKPGFVDLNDDLPFLEGDDRPAEAGDDDACVRGVDLIDFDKKPVDADIVCCTITSVALGINNEVEDDCVAFGPSPSLSA